MTKSDWRVEASMDSMQKALVSDLLALWAAFIWSMTPEGGDFWAKQADKLTDEGRMRLQEMIKELKAWQKTNSIQSI